MQGESSEVCKISNQTIAHADETALPSGPLEGRSEVVLDRCRSSRILLKYLKAYYNIIKFYCLEVKGVVEKKLFWYCQYWVLRDRCAPKSEHSRIIYPHVVRCYFFGSSQKEIFFYKNHYCLQLVRYNGSDNCCQAPKRTKAL